MLDRPRSEVAWEYWLPTPFASFPFTSPPVRHRVPPGSERALGGVVYRERFKLGNGWLQTTEASRLVRKQSRTTATWGSTVKWLCYFTLKKWFNCLTGYVTTFFIWRIKWINESISKKENNQNYMWSVNDTVCRMKFSYQTEHVRTYKVKRVIV